MGEELDVTHPASPQLVGHLRREPVRTDDEDTPAADRRVSKGRFPDRRRGEDTRRDREELGRSELKAREPGVERSDRAEPGGRPDPDRRDGAEHAVPGRTRMAKRRQPDGDQYSDREEAIGRRWPQGEIGRAHRQQYGTRTTCGTHGVSRAVPVRRPLLDEWGIRRGRQEGKLVDSGRRDARLECHDRLSYVHRSTSPS